MVSLAEYGAFLELEPGIEGLVHVSEMSWTKRIKHPSKVVSAGTPQLIFVETGVITIRPVAGQSAPVHLGESAIADLHVGDTLVRARFDRRQRLREGDAVHLAFNPEDIHLFDSQTRRRLAASSF